MHNFYVVDGKKFINYKPGKEAYARALNRVSERIETSSFKSFGEMKEAEPEVLKSWLYLNVKFIPLVFDFERNYSDEEIKNWFLLIEGINDTVGCLTPLEFMQMFPAEKEYDGEKYQAKDYFSTMEYIRSFNTDKPIGREKASELLFAYHNWDINEYMCTWMGIVNRMHRANGGKDITLEFFEEMGTPLHTLHKEGNYMVDDESGDRYEIKEQENKLRKLFSVV